MKQISHVSIPSPCTQNWDNMLPNEDSRFCKNCQKNVTDFSDLSNDQILDVLSSSSDKVCGRFKETQLLALNNQLMADRTPLFSWQKIGLVAALTASVPFVNVQAKVKFRTEQSPVRYKNLVVPPDTNRVDRVIKGNIIDDAKQVVPGVTVKVKGTNIATCTNMAGDFSIYVPAKTDVILVMSFIGYQTEEVKIKAGDKPVYNLQLKATTMTLGAVFVRRPPIWKRPYYAMRRVIRKIF